jgi:hypothetical protein
LRDVCSIFLALLWLVASSHPILESAGLIHQDDHHSHNASPTHDDDGDQDHDAADGKCPVSFAKVSIPKPPATQVPFVLSFSSAELIDGLTFEIDASGLAPPEQLSVPIPSWQFCLRAALAPRAPSSLS